MITTKYNVVLGQSFHTEMVEVEEVVGIEAVENKPMTTQTKDLQKNPLISKKIPIQRSGTREGRD